MADKNNGCAQMNKYEKEMEKGTPKRLALTIASDKPVEKGGK
jgi:hypothetical protein